MPTTAVSDFLVGLHEGTCALAGGGLTAARGTWTSPVYHRGPFDWAVASWNGMGDRIEVEVRVAAPGGWSPWLTYGPWSLTGERHSAPDQAAPGIGRLDADTLLLESPSRAWQFRVHLQNATLRRLWLCHAMKDDRSTEPAHRAAWGADLPVPLRSQMIYPNGGNVWCSPTSVAMVLAFWGRAESIPDQVVPGVYDRVYGGHGNWSFNVAYAGARGFTAWVDRFAGFADLEREIAAGRPVVCSVRYKREWLTEAVHVGNNGHLLVVRGFTPEGDVIVNDPAADSDQGVRAIYRRHNFQRAWLDRGGVVYRILPDAQDD